MVLCSTLAHKSSIEPHHVTRRMAGFTLPLPLPLPLQGPRPLPQRRHGNGCIQAQARSTPSLELLVSGDMTWVAVWRSGSAEWEPHTSCGNTDTDTGWHDDPQRICTEDA
ncbi:hypothetical protein ACJBU6_03125 [Exserohilum turcicum]